MIIAVAGCIHGHFDRCYEILREMEEARDIHIDVLLVCGDCQTIRNQADLSTMSCPDKYKTMGDFYPYYSGAKSAPVLTILIGGNHEASNYFQELPYGGWVAKNIYYLGYSGVVNINGVRIAGVSGIYDEVDYEKGHFEIPPYTKDYVKSVYHVRSCEIRKLKLLAHPDCSDKNINIFMSHDWPQSIYNYGDLKELLKRAPSFARDMNANVLGSPGSLELLDALKPSFWFAAHMHQRFEALYIHKTSDAKKEIGAKSKSAVSASASSTESVDDSSLPATRFYACDKCFLKRIEHYIIEIPTKTSAAEEIFLSYDEDWLAALYATYYTIPFTENENVKKATKLTKPIKLAKEFVRAQFLKRSGGKHADDLRKLYKINETFTMTAPLDLELPIRIGNPQTDALLEILELDHTVTIPWNPNSFDKDESKSATSKEVEEEDDDCGFTFGN